MWSWERFADDMVWHSSVDTFNAENIEVSTNDSRVSYRCDDDGAWATARWEGDDETWTEWTFDPPYLVVPRHLEAGVAWSSEAAWNLVRSDGSEETASETTQFFVETEVNTVIPAGSFTTLQVRVLQGNTEDDWYFARGVGVVLTDEVQLIDWAVP